MRVHETKFFDIITDCNLSWNVHVADLCRKLSKLHYIFYTVRDNCTDKVLKLLYSCLVYSNKIYCSSVWGKCTKTVLEPLLLNHKQLIRALAGARRLDPTAPLYESLRLLKPHQIIQYMTGIFMYKCLNDAEFCIWFRQRRFTYNTRGEYDMPLEVPLISNRHSEQMLTFQGPNTWNQIPLSIRLMPYNSFKFSLKRHLLLCES